MSFSAAFDKIVMAYGHAEWQIVSTHTHEKKVSFTSCLYAKFFCFVLPKNNWKEKFSSHVCELFFIFSVREKSALLTATAESVRITTVQQEIQELSTPCHWKNFFSLLHFYFSFDVKHFVGLSAAFFHFLQLIHSMVHWAQNRKGKAMKKEKKVSTTKKWNLYGDDGCPAFYFFILYFIILFTFILLLYVLSNCVISCTIIPLHRVCLCLSVFFFWCAYLLLSLRTELLSRYICWMWIDFIGNFSLTWNQFLLPQWEGLGLKVVEFDSELFRKKWKNLLNNWQEFIKL